MLTDPGQPETMHKCAVWKRDKAITAGYHYYEFSGDDYVGVLRTDRNFGCRSFDQDDGEEDRGTK